MLTQCPYCNMVLPGLDEDDDFSDPIIQEMPFYHKLLKIYETYNRIFRIVIHKKLSRKENPTTYRIFWYDADRVAVFDEQEERFVYPKKRKNTNRELIRIIDLLNSQIDHFIRHESYLARKYFGNGASGQDIHEQLMEDAGYWHINWGTKPIYKTIHIRG